MALNGTLLSLLRRYTCVFQFWSQLNNYFLQGVVSLLSFPPVPLPVLRAQGGGNRVDGQAQGQLGRMEMSSSREAEGLW